MNTALNLIIFRRALTWRSKFESAVVDMGDVPMEENQEATGTPYDVDGLSPGGQVYANTELGKYVYRGKRTARESCKPDIYYDDTARNTHLAFLSSFFFPLIVTLLPGLKP